VWFIFEKVEQPSSKENVVVKSGNQADRKPCPVGKSGDRCAAPNRGSGKPEEEMSEIATFARLSQIIPYLLLPSPHSMGLYFIFWSASVPTDTPSIHFKIFLR
jgi:hypothetical protein